MTTYAFDNAWQQARDRLQAAEELLDPGTIRHLEALGVGEGWRCLEAGAGGGSIARWLCKRVGRRGSVDATDLDTRFLEQLYEPNLTSMRHDITRDPLPEGAYDCVHARLLVEHLTDRDAALRQLAAALRPGGWLLIEAIDYVSGVPVSDLGGAEHERTQAVRLRLMSESGLDPDFGRRLPAAFRKLGLANIGCEGRVWVMEGGSPAARWFRLSMEQLRQRLAGPDRLSEPEIDRMLELFEDPRWSAMTPTVMAAWGRRA